jgi:branched-chain amino acid transport system substrate-binding protein
MGPALDALNTDDHVVAYLGAVNTPIVAGAPTVEKNQIPFLGVAFAQYSIHQQGYKYLFSPFPKTPAMAKSMFDMLDTLPADTKPKNVGILTEKSDIGNELASMTTQEAGSRSYQVVDTEQFVAGTTDYTDIVSKIKNANVEVLVGIMSAPDAMNIVKEMVKQEYVPKFTMFIRAADGATWATDTEMAGDYVTISPGWSNAMKYPGVDQLNAAYQAKMGRPADPLVGPAYASVQLLADAIERVGSLDHDAIRKAFATTDLQTVVGPVTFNADGTGNVPVALLQYQQGKAQLVWPKEFATANLVYPALPYNQR